MLLQCSGISKSYGTDIVLHNIHLQINSQDRVGLVGRNGAGKSTLLKIIAGELTADSGDIFRAKDVRISYLAQNSGLSSNKGIWEEMLDVFQPLLEMEQELRELERKMADPAIINHQPSYDTLMQRYANLSEAFREQGGYEFEANIRGVLHGMGFADYSYDTPIHTLSGGQKTRLALAKLLLQKPDLLMLDEPTNYLDIPTLTWLENYLRSFPGAIMVVSHDRYFLDAIVQVIYEIERKEAKRYTGNYSKFIETKAKIYETELKHFEKQQESIARMEDFVRRNLARASTTKRAQSRRKMLDRMDRIERPQGDLKKASFSFEMDRQTGKDVLRADGLRKSFPQRGDLFSNINLELRREDRSALIGPNGIGKSTLLKILLGDEKPDEGTITWGSNVKIGYYDQEQTSLNENNTVLEELWSTYPHLEETRIRTVLGNFLFSGEDVLKKISTLSGGEKARVCLAKLMLLNANVLLLDEPTNHLDLYSKEVLEAALLEYEGTVLFISHDRYFLNKMADNIIELSTDSARYFLGNYDDYVEKKRELEEINAEQASLQQAPAKSGHPPSTELQENGASSYEAEKQARREQRARERRIQQLETDIAALEASISELEAELTQPDVFNNYELVHEKSTAIEHAKSKLELLYEEWEVLMLD